LIDFPFSDVKIPHDDDILDLVFVGRVAPEKNLKILIEALNMLKDGSKPFRLSIYGDTRHKNYYAELLSIVQANDLGGIIFFKGPKTQEELKDVYLKADLLCLLSEYEGFSNVLAEGLIHGCIVLSSNIPENASVLVDGENGFLVNTKDIASVENGLHRFFNLNTEERADMRKRNYDKARVLFDPVRVYNHYMKLLESN
jgi:glycosyltransferase involved in cell wall biosynthesis